MKAEQVQQEKKRIIAQVREQFDSTIGREQIDIKSIEQRKKPSERQADELIANYPKLNYGKFIFIGYYGLHKFAKIALAIYLLFSLFPILTGGIGEAIFLFVKATFIVAVGLALYGGAIYSYSGTLKFLSENNEVEKYKTNVVDVYNRFVQLHTENNLGTNFKWIISIRDNNCYFALELLEEGKSWDVKSTHSYLETKFNRSLNVKSVTPEKVEFTVVYVERKLMSNIEAEEKLKRLEEAIQSGETSLLSYRNITVDEVENSYVEAELEQASADDIDLDLDLDDDDDLDMLDLELLAEVEDEMSKIVGLQSVKDKMAQIKTNRLILQERLTAGQSVSFHSEHMLFVGNPGTGKTMMARLVAEMLHALEVVSVGHLVEVTRKDLVGEYIGHTASKAQGVIDQALGGILFIDEAYSLARGGENDFGLEAIDVLVKAMDEHKDDLVVILAGYHDEMDDFLNQNSGLRSRISTVIDFEDYTADELLEISLRKFESNRIQLNEESKHKLYDLIESKVIVGRNDDGNGRLVDKLVQEIMSNQASRLTEASLQENRSEGDIYHILPEDIQGKEVQEVFDVDAELAKIIGNSEVKSFIKGLEAQVKVNEKRKSLNLPTSSASSLHMVFQGNPGTGKTTFARVIADMFRNMGLLKKGHLVEVDRSDLVGAYIGHTEKETKKVIEKALGGVLFIDEAYSLVRDSENDFGKEAIDLLLKAMEDYRDNLVVIVAGYENEMQTFLNANPGLRSRIPNTITFNDYSNEEMYQILLKMIEEASYVLHEDCQSVLMSIFTTEQNSGNSGNGRFVRNLFEQASINMSTRLASYENPTKEDLMILLPSDFSANIDHAGKEEKEVIPHKSNEEEVELLRRELRAFRNKKAKELGYKAYYVFTNETLEEILIHRPKTLEELANVRGFGEKKINTFGEELLAILQD